MKISYTWLCELIPELDKIPAKDLANRLTFAGLEVEGIESISNDVIFEVNVTPNRGDALSHWGIACDILALTGLSLNLTAPKENVAVEKKVATFKINQVAQTACPRYSASQIFQVKVVSSPAWLSQRLESLGVRSINNIVDATNYVMLLTGHPVHAFDADKVVQKTIVIKEIESALKFKTLDGIERQLIAGDLVIADPSGPIALAGIMGGENSEVSPNTQNLILEVAYFDPDQIRKTAKRLGIKTESSYRFERHVNPATVLQAHQILQDLMIQLAGGDSTDILDLYKNKIQAIQIQMPLSDVKKYLGIEVPQEKVIAILKGIGCEVKIQAESLSVSVPLSRSDLLRPIDLIEEIARMHGMENIPATMPSLQLRTARESAASKKERQIKDYFVAAGFDETLHYSFGDQQYFEKILKPTDTTSWITLKNPLSEEFGVMRPSLLPGLLKTFVQNYPLVKKGVRLFECRCVYSQEKDKIIERKILAGLYSGNPLGRNRFGLNRVSDFFDGKGLLDGLFKQAGIKPHLQDNLEGVFHPAQSLAYLVGNEVVASVGALHPELLLENKIKEKVYYFEIDYQRFIDIYQKTEFVFKPISSLPNVYRDLALLVPKNLSHQDILNVILKEKPELLQCVELFDLYEGPNLPKDKKSLAYSFIYQPSGASLTDEAVNQMHFALVEKLKQSLGVELR